MLLKPLTLLVILLAFCVGDCLAQSEVKPFSDPSFVEFMAGVKYAFVGEDINHEEGYYLTSSKTGLYDFLASQRIIPVAKGNPQGPCDIVWVYYSYRVTEYGLLNMPERIEDLVVRFKSCTGEEWQLKFPKNFLIAGMSVGWRKFSKKVRAEFNRHRVKIPRYNSAHRREIIKNPITASEANFRAYLAEESSDFLEGIYEKVSDDGARYRLGLVKEKGLYRLFFLSASRLTDEFRGIWFPGDLKGILSQTSSAKFFKVDYLMANKTLNQGVFIELREGQMLITINDSTDTYLKVFPLNE